MSKDNDMITTATFTITGEIADFSRLDDVYKVLKREGAKLLKNWTLTVTAEYTESQTPTG
jgi:hypothetical protein